MAKNHFPRHLCAVAVSAALMGFTTHSFAADETTAAEEQEQGLETIEVTARRTVENLQEVPVSLTSIGATELAEKGIAVVTDIQQKAPNTTLQVSRGTNSTLTAYIRGIGQQDPLWGFEPGVGVYIDDIYVARPQGAVLDVYDVQRIEILRGPQGTLYGKNTIGGAVKYVTKPLSGDYELDVQGAVGNYGQRDFKIAGQAPLIEDKLYFGAAFASLNRDGFGEFLNTGAENYDKDVTTGRVSLEYHASSDLIIKFAADQTTDKSNARGGHRLTRSIITGAEPPTDVFDSLTSMPTDNEVETSGESIIVDWAINDSWSFKSISSHRQGTTNTNIDFDNTEVASLDVPAYYDDEQFTQELQLSYVGDGVKGIGGIYYYDGDACGAFDVILGNFGITLENGGCVETKSIAAYAQASFEIDDKWSATVGGRYTKDKKKANVYRYLYLGTKYPHQDVGAPLAIQSDFTGEEEWSRFSPRLGLEYKMDSDLMLYGSYTNGFKSGGFDMRANVSVNPFAEEPYDPEIVDTYEIGFKSELMDNDVRLNGALFYSDYKDMQLTIQRATSDGTDFASQVMNAGKSTVMGGELEMLASLADGLTMNMAVGVIDAEFDTVDYFDPAVQAVRNVANEWSFANTPEMTATIGFDYEFSNEYGDFVWSSSLAYRSETQIFEIPSQLDFGGYSIINTGLTYYHIDGNWSASLHMRNLGDKEYRIAGYNFAATYDAQGNVVSTGLGGEDTVIGYYGDPRTITLTVGYRF